MIHSGNISKDWITISKVGCGKKQITNYHCNLFIK